MVTTAAWAAPAMAAPPMQVNNLVTVPDVTHSTLRAAQDQMNLVGLNWGVSYIDNDCTIDRVIWTDPGHGVQVSPGTRVILHVHPICNGPQD